MSERLFFTVSACMVLLAVSALTVIANTPVTPDSEYDNHMQDGYAAFKQREAFLSVSREHLNDLAPAAGDVSKN